MSLENSAVQVQPSEVKRCCARLYESDAVKLLLGDSFHPGGLKLTERLGQLVRLRPGSRLLDVASGKGTSAIFLAERFGCEVVGIDYSDNIVGQARREAAAKGLSRQVRFQHADAESLPFADGSFDAIVCECAFCTFPDKSRTAHELARVVCNGGRVGLSDLTRGPELPKELEGLLAWVACIADAQPIENYIHYLSSAKLTVEVAELHDESLIEMVRQIQVRLLGTEIMSGLKKIDISGLDLTGAKQMARAALAAIERGQLGYAIITAEKETMGAMTPSKSGVTE